MKIDWSSCVLVQHNPEYQSGAPPLPADPRMTVDTLVECSDDGMKPAEIAGAYKVPLHTISQLLDYAAEHRALAFAGS